MKKILLSIAAGVVLVSCGSMQQVATSNTTASTTTTEQTTAQTTTTTESTYASSSASSALSSMISGAIQSATQTQTAVSESFTAGNQSGVALKALYDQYKTDGKLDLSNLSNVANVLNVSAQVQKISQADKATVSYSDFAKGLIEGSANLVNELNAEQITEALITKVGNVDTSKLDETTDKAQTAVSNISSAASSVAASASSIMEVINLFK